VPPWPHGHPVPRPPDRRADARGLRPGAVLVALSASAYVRRAASAAARQLPRRERDL